MLFSNCDIFLKKKHTYLLELFRKKKNLWVNLPAPADVNVEPQSRNRSKPTSNEHLPWEYIATETVPDKSANLYIHPPL